MKKNFSLKSAYSLLFYLTLAFLMIDWAFPHSIIGGMLGIYELLFAALAVIFVILQFREKGAFFKQGLTVLKSSKVLLTVLGLYILMGVITLFYAQAPTALFARYFNLVQMAVLSVLGLYQVFAGDDPRRELRRMTLTLGIAGAVIAVMALGSYMIDFRTTYTQYISPIVDYNQYATLLLIGFVSLTLYLISSECSAMVKYPLLLVTGSLFASCIYAAGSRRSYVLLLVVAAILGLVAIGKELLSALRDKQWKRPALSVVLILVCFLSAFLCVRGTSDYTARTHLARKDSHQVIATPDSSQTPELPPVSEDVSGLKENYDTIGGSAIKKRLIIWQAAINKVRQSDIPHLLFGYGASYSTDLYSQLDPETEQVFRAAYQGKDIDFSTRWMNPHNLFLQDMLEGGLVLLLLQLTLLVLCLIEVIRIMRRDFMTGLLILLSEGIILCTLVLSSAEGLIAHKFVWIFLLYTVCAKHLTAEKCLGGSVDAE